MLEGGSMLENGEIINPRDPRGPHDADAAVGRGTVFNQQLRLAERIVLWLDQRLLDPIIGLVLPGAGDIMTTGVGLYIVVLAWKMRVPAVVLARMLLNLAVDALVGSIPVVGDAFDLFFWANARNLRLLKSRLASAPDAGAARSSMGDWLLVGLTVLLLVAGVAIPIVFFIWAWPRLRHQL